MKVLKENWQLLAIIAIIIVAAIVLTVKHTKLTPIKNADGSATGESKLMLDFSKKG